MDIDYPLFLFTTAAAMLSTFLQPSLKIALRLLLKESSNNAHLMSEIAEVKKEMESISMVDEFARHARLQRKLNKLQEAWNVERRNLTSTRTKYNFILGLCCSVTMALVMIPFLYMFRSRPVLILPTEWLSPISPLLAWPSEEIGAVSVLCWLAVCNGVSRILNKRLNA